MVAQLEDLAQKADLNMVQGLLTDLQAKQKELYHRTDPANLALELRNHNVGNDAVDSLSDRTASRALWAFRHSCAPRVTLAGAGFASGGPGERRRRAPASGVNWARCHLPFFAYAAANAGLIGGNAAPPGPRLERSRSVATRGRWDSLRGVPWLWPGGGL